MQPRWKPSLRRGTACPGASTGRHLGGQALGAEAVALEEARQLARSRELQAASGAEAAAEEAAAARSRVGALASERDSLAAAVGSLQVGPHRPIQMAREPSPVRRKLC